MQIVGIILAFETKSVEVDVLNDSKFVAAYIGVTSIIHIFVALVIVNFALETRINFFGGIFSGGILLLATMSLALTFIPKVYITWLYRYPHNIIKLRPDC